MSGTVVGRPNKWHGSFKKAGLWNGAICSKPKLVARPMRDSELSDFMKTVAPAIRCLHSFRIIWRRWQRSLEHHLSESSTAMHSLRCMSHNDQNPVRSFILLGALAVSDSTSPNVRFGWIVLKNSPTTSPEPISRNNGLMT